MPMKPTADCDRVLEVLGEARLPPALEAHLATCEYCRGARSAYEAMTPAAAPAVGIAGSGLDDPRPFATAGMACVSTEIALSAVPVAFALWLLARSTAFSPMRALVVGLAGGATGMVALHIHCPIGTPEHLFVFHVLPWVLIALGAVAVRRRLPTR